MKVHGYEMTRQVIDALCRRLDQGPAAGGELVKVAVTAGAPMGRERIASAAVYAWCRLQRQAGRIELADRRWQITDSALNGKTEP